MASNFKPMLQTIAIIVKGKVQGVFLRQTAKELALQIGVKGFVKNLANGDVQITVTGTEEQLNQFTEWCRTGPANAKVLEIVVNNLPFIDFTSFRIER